MRATLSLGRQLWGFMRVRKKFWLLPVIMLVGLVGGRRGVSPRR